MILHSIIHLMDKRLLYFSSVMSGECEGERNEVEEKEDGMMEEDIPVENMPMPIAQGNDKKYHSSTYYNGFMNI